MVIGVLLVVGAVVARRVGRGSASDAGEPGGSGVIGSQGSGTSTSALPAGTTSPTTPTDGLGSGAGPKVRGRTPLRGFSEVKATIADPSGRTCEVCLLAATTEAQRQRGLMEVTDRSLGGYDGMVFRFPADDQGAFWMRNTPMPLSIAYFDRSGALVSSTDMAPCADSPSCPDHPASGPYRAALEVPQGRLVDLGVTGKGAKLQIDATRCPLPADLKRSG